MRTGQKDLQDKAVNYVYSSLPLSSPDILWYLRRNYPYEWIH